MAAGAAALPALLRIARAQAYPTRPVRLIVGNPAGGGNDIIARLMGQWLSERLGQQFVVDMRTVRGRAPISQLRPSCARNRMAIRYLLSALPRPSTPRFTRSLISISFE